MSVPAYAGGRWGGRDSLGLGRGVRYLGLEVEGEAGEGEGEAGECEGEGR